VKDGHQVRERHRLELAGEKIANLEHAPVLPEQNRELRIHVLRQRRPARARARGAAAPSGRAAAFRNRRFRRALDDQVGGFLFFCRHWRFEHRLRLQALCAERIRRACFTEERRGRR
jgi:hypothetical protein